MGNLLTRAKFSLPTGRNKVKKMSVYFNIVDTESITIRYADPFVLMRDLQGFNHVFEYKVKI